MKGILIPHAYQVRSLYRTDPYYRATFFAAGLAIAAALIMGIFYYSHKTARDEMLVRKAETEAEEQTLANRRRILRPTMESYSQIQSWKNHRRVAVTPVLSWLEKRIPPEESITSLQIVFDKITPGVPRRAEIKFTLFITPAAGEDNAVATSWLNTAIDDFSKAGISIQGITKSEPVVLENIGRTIDVSIQITQNLSETAANNKP